MPKPVQRSESTRAALIAAAEHLFGTKGLDEVSTREILDLAGQKNQSALQYHFKNRAGLLWAILDARLSKIEARRKAMIEAIPQPGKETIHELLEVFVRPLTEIVNEDKQGSAYVQFVVQSAHRPEGDLMATIDSGRYPTLTETSRRLDLKLAAFSKGERQLRKRLIYNALMGAVATWDAYGKHHVSLDEFVEIAVRAAAPFIDAPLAKCTP